MAVGATTLARGIERSRPQAAGVDVTAGAELLGLERCVPEGGPAPLDRPSKVPIQLLPAAFDAARLHAGRRRGEFAKSAVSSV